MVVHVIQSEWIFLQCVTNNMGDAFAVVEKMIWGTFAFPFLRKFKISRTHCRNSKYDAGQKIRPRPPESCDTREQKYLSSRRASMELIGYVTR